MIESTSNLARQDERRPQLNYAVRLIAGGGIPWNEITNLRGSNSSLRDVLGEELSDLGVQRCFLTREGLNSERVAPTDEFEQVLRLKGTAAIHHSPTAANAVWLAEKGDAFTDLAHDRLMFCASAGDLFLAGRYTSWMAEKTAAAFRKRLAAKNAVPEKEVDLSDVTVVSFFRAPVGRTNKAQEFEMALAHAGITSFVEASRIPPAGEFPYAGHGKGHKVGIIARI